MSSWLHRYALAVWLAALAFASDAADRHEAGRSIYNFRCYFCHGYSGDARTLAATYLSPPPRDFTRSTPDALTREAMLRAVTDGRAGTAMKGFAGILRPEEIAEVVDFVREEFMRRKAQNTALSHRRQRLGRPRPASRGVSLCNGGNRTRHAVRAPDTASTAGQAPIPVHLHFVP